MELEIMKAEEGVCAGRVLYHSRIQKTPQEAAAQAAAIQDKEQLRQKRKKQQVSLLTLGKCSISKSTVSSNDTYLENHSRLEHYVSVVSYHNSSYEAINGRCWLSASSSVSAQEENVRRKAELKKRKTKAEEEEDNAQAAAGGPTKQNKQNKRSKKEWWEKEEGRRQPAEDDDAEYYRQEVDALSAHKFHAYKGLFESFTACNSCMSCTEEFATCHQQLHENAFPDPFYIFGNCCNMNVTMAACKQAMTN